MPWKRNEYTYWDPLQGKEVTIATMVEKDGKYYVKFNEDEFTWQPSTKTAILEEAKNFQPNKMLVDSTGNVMYQSSRSGDRWYSSAGELRLDENTGQYITVSENLEDKTKTAWEEYRTGVESDFEQAMQLAKNYQQRSGQYLSTYGQQAAQDLRTDYRNLSSRAHQDLVSRGLANTTIAANVPATYQKQLNSALGNLQSNVNQQRLYYDQGATNQMIDLLKSRTRIPLDYQAYTQLQQSLGKAYGG